MHRNLRDIGDAHRPVQVVVADIALSEINAHFLAGNDSCEVHSIGAAAGSH